jgi:hypothetical protein
MFKQQLALNGSLHSFFLFSIFFFFCFFGHAGKGTLGLGSARQELNHSALFPALQ